jgi:PAS domain S-box-containing protein
VSRQGADLINLIPYDLILNSAGVGIYGVDTKGNATFFNRAAGHMLGWKPGEILGRHTHRLLHHSKEDGKPYPEKDCPIYAALKDGTVHAIYDEVLWTKDKKAVPVESISTPIHKNDAIVGAVVTFTDRIKCEVAREALEVFARHPQSTVEFSEWCIQQTSRND